jgi:hypothetical protein
MSEGRRRERAADPGRQECQMAARRCSDNSREFRVHRNGEFGAGLLLLDAKDTVADVLRSHTDHIATTLPAIEQERER